jgi:hypothetical protein
MNSANMLLLVQLAIKTGAELQEFLALIAKGEVSDEELDAAVARYEAARSTLVEDIARARREGR